MSRLNTSGNAIITSEQPQPDAPFTPTVRASLAHNASVTRRRAANFYYGLRLTPEPKRSAVYTIYAVLRACDDIVDGETADRDAPTRIDRQAALDRFEHEVHRAAHARDPRDLPAGLIWPAFHDVMRRYALDPALFRSMIAGQRQDLRHTPIDTFDDLYAYCYRVASTVGLMCIAVWGHNGSAEVKRLAEQRGIALQLTNILRDVREDARAGRLYLPSSEVEAAGCSVQQLRAGRADASFDRLMHQQIERARAYYEASAGLERHLSADCRATSAALAGLYRALLERIAQAPRRVLRGRVQLGLFEKLSIATRAWWRRGRIGDASLPSEVARKADHVSE